MKQVTFVTGNEGKVKYLQKFLGMEIAYHQVDVDEIQSLDLREIVSHKLEQAYQEVGTPVLVEDGSLKISAFGKLPGPFIKWFLEQISLNKICRMIDGADRSCVVQNMIGYYDGSEKHFFKSSVSGLITLKPQYGNQGFGYDPIVIIDGYDVSNAQLSERDYEQVYKSTKPLEQLKVFLEER